MLSDEALMLDFQRGSRTAFEELFERYREPMYGFFRRRLYDSHRAEDLTHEVFLALMKGCARYEPRAALRTYLYGIAFKLLAAERRSQRKDRYKAEAQGEPNSVELSDSTLWVREAIAKLDPMEREILMLREYEQLNYIEIAELLRIPVNTVRSRLFRCRMTLKSYLEPAPQERASSER
ncbi:MAG: RNA polymerase sigma factor [Bryobacteraceae bacterium]